MSLTSKFGWLEVLNFLILEVSGSPGAYIRFFVNILIEVNVSISNELIFSDVCRSVNYIGSLAKFT